jgi:hypothetical protein
MTCYSELGWRTHTSNFHPAEAKAQGIVKPDTGFECRVPGCPQKGWVWRTYQELLRHNNQHPENSMETVAERRARRIAEGVPKASCGAIGPRKRKLEEEKP